MEKRNCYFKNLSEKEGIPKRIGIYWTPDEENEVLEMLFCDFTIEEIAEFLDRTPGSISSRLRRIALQEYDKGNSFDEIYKKTNVTQEEIEDMIEKRINKKEKKSEKRFIDMDPKKQTEIQYMIILKMYQSLIQIEGDIRELKDTIELSNSE